MCYMCHRVFLPMSHAWKSNKMSFNGKKELRFAPYLLKGIEIVEILKDFENEFDKKIYEKENRWSMEEEVNIFFSYWDEIRYVIILM